MYDDYNTRPSAFFSETTWYSEYLVFGLILIMLRVIISKNYKLFLVLPLFILGIILSATRNSYLGLLVYLVLSLLFIFANQKINIKMYINKYTVLIVVFIVLSFISLKEYVMPYIELTIDKFYLKDASGLGRIDAFYMSIEDVMVNPIFGQGFYWDTSMSTDTGTAVGAKSFNLFFMILHIFGFFGFLAFLLLILYYYLNSIARYIKTRSVFIKYSIIIFTIFLTMSMFAPLHQYPFGMYIIALSLYLYRLVDVWRRV
ncbi:O-antigen ligase family protein [Candidatus Methanoperedens nitratireducens]|uniref:O-antigen ligase-related domain-containing protein n=1 Tax=Candidatus Methanoperedens nitratireducens TaxID=1392998 RepID=A0A284VNT0_9EURY|nr:O-antigen ligase family protein [Candidatus Methanoperedens nitroreducens]SNQ60931.1 membrane hypothetical protein [Candidatus Methanoperedens nitroreducens]